MSEIQALSQSIILADATDLVVWCGPLSVVADRLHIAIHAAAKTVEGLPRFDPRSEMSLFSREREPRVSVKLDNGGLVPMNKTGAGSDRDACWSFISASDATGDGINACIISMDGASFEVELTASH